MNDNVQYRGKVEPVYVKCMTGNLASGDYSCPLFNATGKDILITNTIKHMINQSITILKGNNRISFPSTSEGNALMKNILLKVSYDK